MPLWFALVVSLAVHAALLVFPWRPACAPPPEQVRVFWRAAPPPVRAVEPSLSQPPIPVPPPPVAPQAVHTPLSRLNVQKPLVPSVTARPQPVQTPRPQPVRQAEVVSPQPTEAPQPVNPRPVRQAEAVPVQASAVENPSVASSAEEPVQTVLNQADGPSFARRVLPRYPPLALRQGMQGAVVLCVVIDELGAPVSVEVQESTHERFAQAALDAIRASRFHPARRDGRAVACRVLVPVTFVLQD